MSVSLDDVTVTLLVTVLGASVGCFALFCMLIILLLAAVLTNMHVFARVSLLLHFAC